TQTTLSMDDANVIIDAIKKKYPNVKAPPSEDICYATTNRQHAVRALAGEADAVVVVGSKNSSNSVRLTEIAENSGTKAYLVDDMGATWGWPRFRARQLLKWVYEKGVADPSRMTDLSQRDRQLLTERLAFNSFAIDQHQSATDGTQKLLLRLGAGPQCTECVM